MRAMIFRTLILSGAALALLGAGVANAQPSGSGLSDILKGIASQQSATKGGSSLTQGDAAAGLREALQVSAVAVTTKLGRPDGFFADPRVKIPLPGALGKAQRALAPLGMAAPLDDLQRRVNRGAEAAMPQAKTLFVNAVRSMTVSDALSIVRGGDDAGTQYLRAKSGDQLTALLRPQMETALTQAGAFTALDRAGSSAGVASASQSLRTDLINFAVGKALDGAFGYMADEERAIRHDPVKRTSAILRKVFGAGG